MIKTAIHLYWYSLQREDGKENYGDALAPYLVSKLSGRKIKRVSYLKSKKYKYLFKHYFTIGSIIKRATKNSIIWGSGIIKKDENVKNAKFLAVRGPITRARLIDLGYQVPKKYGDPSILLPNFIKNKKQIKYEFGIIPHYVDYSLFKELFLDDERVKVFDLLTDDVEKTTCEILECKYILSSSLHGVIVPHAYKIPTLWVRFSESLSGDDSKFYDYFESVGISYNQVINVNSEHMDYNFLKNLIDTNSNLLLPNKELFEMRISDLMETCPF